MHIQRTGNEINENKNENITQLPQETLNIIKNLLKIRHEKKQIFKLT